MAVTNILSIDNSDKDITTTLHLPCIADNVCILTVTSCGKPVCRCLPPEHAMSVCISLSGTVVVPSTTYHPCRGARQQRSLSRDRVSVKECLPHHESLIIDEESFMFPDPSRRAALVAADEKVMESPSTLSSPNANINNITQSNGLDSPKGMGPRKFAPSSLIQVK